MAFFRRLFIDFDSFYASVEQQDNEEYRGKPVIVVPVVSDYTCAIAASYQAKRPGIFSLAVFTRVPVFTPSLLA